jgi:NAD(P)-dependent dehydrogenase (short-subunit alcohol dehydrogenase family)
MASKSQVILVVGGTSGIGYAITQSILSSPYLPLNAKVIAFGLIDSTIKLEFTKQQRERLRIVEGDVTVNEDRELAVQTCFNVFGGLDTLVYCAGVITPIQKLEKLDIEAVKRSFDINVFGAMSMVGSNPIAHIAYSLCVQLAFALLLLLMSARFNTHFRISVPHGRHTPLTPAAGKS